MLIAVLWHQFLSICPVVGLVPFSEWSHLRKGKTVSTRQCVYSSPKSFCFCIWCSAHLSLLAYECCRVKSKSFSRFLLCSLLQTSSSPRFSSSPSSSFLFWGLVGCGEQVCTTNCKSRFLSLWKYAFLKAQFTPKTLHVELFIDLDCFGVSCCLLPNIMRLNSALIIVLTAPKIH